VVVDLRLVVEYHQMAQRRTLQSGFDGQIQICSARGEHPRLDLVNDRLEYRYRGPCCSGTDTKPRLAHTRSTVR
jgi:hypothetical protein